MRRPVVLFSFCAVALSAAFIPQSADAAEFTDVLDAADDKDDFKEETFDPFDFNFETKFTYDLSSAQITREAPCVPDASGATDLVADNPRLVTGRGRCSEPGIIYNKEMLYRHTQARMDFTLRAGIYKDLEFRLNVPYVIDSTYGLKYDDSRAGADEGIVDATNSSVDPSTPRIQQHASNVFSEGSYEDNIREFDRYTLYRYFELSDQHRNFSRSGFADPTINIDWAPFNDQRDDTKATLLIGAGYKMPIAPIREADDTDVGEGMHELQFRIRSSKQFDWIEPYFGMEYFLPLAAGNSPIREYDAQNNEGQVFVNPPQRGEITIGSEFIPFEDEKKGERYAFDLRFTMGYVSEGLDYTPLYEHMANSKCNDMTAEDVTPEWEGPQGNRTVANPDDVACGWVIQRPANGDPEPVYDPASMGMQEREQTTFSTNGIMTVEDHGTFAGLAGFYLQPSEYFQLKFLAQLKHRQEHFLTNSRTGRDTENEPDTQDDTVDLTGPDSRIERNPIYNPTYDRAGNRFRVEEWNTWSFMVNAALQF